MIGLTRNWQSPSTAGSVYTILISISLSHRYKYKYVFHGQSYVIMTYSSHMSFHVLLSYTCVCHWYVLWTHHS